MFTVIKAIKSFELMICESEFIIETNNRTVISWLKRIPVNNLNKRILKWQSYLSDYAYSTQYIEGKKIFLLIFYPELIIIILV